MTTLSSINTVFQHALKTDWSLQAALLTGVLAFGVSLVLTWLHPAWILSYIYGVILGFGHLSSFFIGRFANKTPLVLALTYIRMIGFAWLIVWAGHGELTKVGVVFCGFFSYKLCLVVSLLLQLPPYRQHKVK